jgi:DNA topoisomerase-1
MSDLFIIEAPGKIQVLRESLKNIGIEAKVEATSGHLYAMPKSLTPMGIDQNFRDFSRSLKDPQKGQYLRTAVSEATRVFIATDADQEGEVIAWDVAELIADIFPSPMRVRMRGMDDASVREAVDQCTPVSKKDAVAGRTRAIIDRMIGGTLSHDGIRVGRIVTGLLGIVNEKPLPVAKLRLAAPAADGKRPWVAECDVSAPISSKIADQLADIDDFPALGKKRSSKPHTSKPGHMGNIMVRAGDVMNMPVDKAAEALQKLYEAGKLSYPRASSRGLSEEAAKKIVNAVKNSGYHMQQEKVTKKSEDDVHDSPYPIGKVNVVNEPKAIGDYEGLRTLIARDLIKTGQEHVIEEAFGAPVRDHLLKRGFSREIAEHIGNLPWRREEGPRYPGQTGWPKSEVVERNPDTVLLEAAINRGLGRPSSWAKHITQFLADGIVDGELRLTAKGKVWVAGSPPALLDPRISAAIENACEKVQPEMLNDPNREPWELLAERIVTVLPQAIKEPLMKVVEGERPRPKEDKTAMFKTTVGLDEVLEKTKEKVLAYAPKMPSFED